MPPELNRPRDCGDMILPAFSTSAHTGTNLAPAASGGAAGTLPAEAPDHSKPWMEQILSIALIAIVLIAAGATIFIILTPGEGDAFTEFYILGPGGKAADYPTEFMAGTPQTVIIGIGNHERQDITYTVQTFAVQAKFDGVTNQTAITSAMLLDQFSVTVPYDQTVEQPYTFRIMDPDTNRIEFLLFKEMPPETHNSDLIDAGYRDLHLWLRVH
ncbi:MAG: DUF1616 domain-containing protein [Methanoculleus sp.]|jgi:uncharacterized membrane protein